MGETSDKFGVKLGVEPKKNISVTKIMAESIAAVP
jgi:hypothetical protein